MVEFFKRDISLRCLDRWLRAQSKNKDVLVLSFLCAVEHVWFPSSCVWNFLGEWLWRVHTSVLKLSALHGSTASGFPTVCVKHEDDTSGSNTNTHKPIPLTVKRWGAVDKEGWRRHCHTECHIVHRFKYSGLFIVCLSSLKTKWIDTVHCN